MLDHKISFLISVCPHNSDLTSQFHPSLTLWHLAFRSVTFRAFLLALCVCFRYARSVKNTRLTSTCQTGSNRRKNHNSKILSFIIFHFYIPLRPIRRRKLCSQRWEFIKENKKVRKKERFFFLFFVVAFLIERVFSFFFLDRYRFFS